ncbi:hypothetical protein FB567DRAFT_259935 [Paraphoma chrysanthemicola]|uniref:Uncharacterized protein n=1 Tax=Paraphoma chrysanthemicola TaxID=798071 RepID=A0A8K0QT08_9PLEO|nr:hypothetical protein FB567DRAFT_259935 [Paraphoma chrysanthemicola]
MSSPNCPTPSTTAQDSGSDTSSSTVRESDENDASPEPTTISAQFEQDLLDDSRLRDLDYLMSLVPTRRQHTEEARPPSPVEAWMLPAPVQPTLNMEDFEEVDLGLDLGEDLDGYNPVFAEDREKQGEVAPNAAPETTGDIGKGESVSEDVESRPASSAGSEGSGIAAPHTVSDSDSSPSSGKRKLEHSEDGSKGGADTFEEAHHGDRDAKTADNEDGVALPRAEQPDQPQASLAPEEAAPPDDSSEATTVVLDAEEKGDEEGEEAPATTMDPTRGRSVQILGSTYTSDPGCIICSDLRTAVFQRYKCGCRLVHRSPSVTESEKSPPPKRRKRAVVRYV